MEVKSAQKGIAHLGIIVVVIVLLVGVVGYFIFSGGRPERFFMDSVGPPPADPAARKAWFSENFMSMDKKIYVLDEELPSWRELDQLNESLSDRSYPTYIKACLQRSP